MAESTERDLDDLRAEIARLRQTLAGLADAARQGLPVAEAQTTAQKRLAALEAQAVALGDVYGDVVAGDKITAIDQRGQRVERQTVVAGDYVDQRRTVVEPGASPGALRRAYLHRLAQQTRRLPLTGVDPKAAGTEECSELQLSAVYTALLTQRHDTTVEEIRSRISSRSRGNASEEIERIKGDTRRLSALEMLNREPRLVLLGDPGSGKSTFVNFVALCLAGEALGDDDANLSVLTSPLPGEKRDREPQPQPWDHGPLLPVRIVLRDLAARGLPDSGEGACPELAEGPGSDALWAFIVTELGEVLKEYGPHLKRELLERGGLILLDGLDEVPDARQQRAQVKQAVQGFAADFPRCRFLVTSRTYAYQRQDWKLDGFTEVVLSPFTPAQIVCFVDSWYLHIGAVRGLHPDDAQGRAALLKTAIERSERLTELATRPLLLTLMASLHAWRGGSLPEKREELYADTVDLLLDQWESPKVVRDASGKPLLRQPSLTEWLAVDRAVMRAELNRLAFEAHRDQSQLVGTADFSQERLVGRLMSVTKNPDAKPARLIEYVRDRAGLLAARGEGVYTFPHRTFQEYLAACHLTDHGFPDDLADLLRADPQRWREAVLLAGAKAARGTSAGAWFLAEALCYREPPSPDDVCPEPDCWGALLAAQTLLENEGQRLERVSERDAPKLERIRRWLLAIVTLGWLPPVDRALAGQALAVLGDDRDFDELVTVPAGPFLMGSSETDEMAFSGEKPQYELTLPAFKIGKYPITNTQYLSFVSAGGYDERRYWTKDGWGQKGREGWAEPRVFGAPFNLPNHPVVGVSWYEAVAYCRWLTGVWRAGGKIGGGEVVRLPTEAEWEKAASWEEAPPASQREASPPRAEWTAPASRSEAEWTEGGRKRRYPWGNAFDAARCNMGDTGIGSTSAVGCFPGGASPYGVLDLSGNVWEWTRSIYESYPYDPDDGREDPERTGVRVVRGGAFYYSQSYVRCALRLRSAPADRNFNLGFRIVVAPG